MLLSILIPTLECRARQFAALEAKLEGQIQAHALESEVEVLSLLDRGERTTGAKRNMLLDRASGRFVCSVDDDDDVRDDYVPLIVEALRRHPEVDCLGIKGQITFRGRHPHTFIYSCRFAEYRVQGGVYLRPPHHLNPIRHDIALRYRFKDVRVSEDVDWALRIARDRALQREYFVEQTLYYYLSRRHWAYQLLLDRTEPIRHPLGIQLVNRFRLQRWLRSLARLGPDA